MPNLAAVRSIRRSIPPNTVSQRNVYKIGIVGVYVMKFLIVRTREIINVIDRMHLLRANV